jgi:hypothetical protein
MESRLRARCSVRRLLAPIEPGDAIPKRLPIMGRSVADLRQEASLGPFPVLTVQRRTGPAAAAADVRERPQRLLGDKDDELRPKARTH